MALFVCLLQRSGIVTRMFCRLISAFIIIRNWNGMREREKENSFFFSRCTSFYSMCAFLNLMLHCLHPFLSHTKWMIKLIPRRGKKARGTCKRQLIDKTRSREEVGGKGDKEIQKIINLNSMRSESRWMFDFCCNVTLLHCHDTCLCSNVKRKKNSFNWNQQVIISCPQTIFLPSFLFKLLILFALMRAKHALYLRAQFACHFQFKLK